VSEPRLVRPQYAEHFRCIGSDCEDTCCQGWSVPIDRAAFDKYQSLPPSPLRVLVDANIQISPAAAEPDKADASKTAVFAKIRMTTNNQCPMLSEDHLCRIQTECGESFLSHTCATYPRIVNSVDGEKDVSLTLSCPEAARLVLLAPDLLGLLSPQLNAPISMPMGQGSASSNAADSAFKPRAHFWAIRATVLSLIGNRSYPLWQRLFLLGIFCRRLDSIAKGELARTVPDFLRDFEAAVSSGSLLPAMETLPVDRSAQLDIVLQLAGMLLHRSNVLPRFVECIQAFTAGIGNGPKATLESLTAQYAVAHDLSYAPFFERHPHILENYLINTVLRCHFPFGKSGSQPGIVSNLTREFALLTAQFALMKGLLIGVAGYHREAFSVAHVVHTVQAASKHFEHHPEFLNQAHTLLMENQMDGARGLAILLRNTEPAAPKPTVPSIHVPVPQVGTQA